MAATTAAGQPFDQIVVFGDSLSDNGNRVALSASTRLVYGAYRRLYGLLCGNKTTAFMGGRHTDGPVAVEVLAQQFGLSLEPAWAVPGGTNFAVSGALVGQAGVARSLEQQIDEYFDRIGGETTLSPNTLFVVYIGGNDVLHGSSLDRDRGEQHMARAADGVGAAIRRLAARGAKRFLVPNQGDVGNTPMLRRFWHRASRGRAATRLSLFFNCRLAPILDALETELDVAVARVDAISLGRRLRAEAPKHGWTNVTDACLFTFCGCRFDEYFFFDSLHPTASRHRLNGHVLIQATTTLTPDGMSASGY
jgi:phospholipase/lecithinase/hemolysin